MVCRIISTCRPEFILGLQPPVFCNLVAGTPWKTEPRKALNFGSGFSTPSVGTHNGCPSWAFFFEAAFGTQISDPTLKMINRQCQCCVFANNEGCTSIEESDGPCSGNKTFVYRSDRRRFAGDASQGRQKP